MIGINLAEEIGILRMQLNGIRIICKNTEAKVQKKTYTYGLWVRWKAGGTTAFEVAYISYEYLLSIQGTDLERDVVTLHTARGNCLNINLADTSAYQIFRKERKERPYNPLEDEEVYNDPLN